MTDTSPADTLTLQHFQALQVANLKTQANEANGWFFFIPAKNLYMHTGRPSCWKWKQEAFLQVAELINTKYLYVAGSEKLKHFEIGKEYEVMFLVKMTNTAEFQNPVQLILELPGEKKERPVDLMKIGRNKWVHVRVNYFTAPKNRSGEVKFSLTNVDDTTKSGLVIGGALIQPCSSE